MNQDRPQPAERNRLGITWWGVVALAAVAETFGQEG
jgi:hypothetical protein